MKVIDLKLEKLQTFLDQNEIPKIKGKPKTFLGIAKQPHYENVLSNIYAFYFKVNEVHKFNDLFVTSLLELINKDTIHIESFFDFNVFTEFSVSDQKRIDILLHNNDQAIIIENKVYHHLNNDLALYYNDVEAANKIGIVLSLHPINNISHPHFINITHFQLLTKVMSNLGSYILNANDKYIVFLKDFYQNTINLSTEIMKTTDIDFYIKNRDSIHQTARFLNKFKDYIKLEVEKACHLLNDDVTYLKLNNTGNRLRYYQSIKVPNLMFTVGFDTLYTDNQKQIWIAVELKGSNLKNPEAYNVIDFSSEEKDFINSDFYTKKHSSYAHFAGASYYLEKDKLPFDNLAEFIANKILDDHLFSIFQKLENFINTQKK
ncbi:PD-(D/E)XK nuclease family protein [Formosa algae]|uniref:PD-(D/E)XK nuclease family protein n=1 Tax=Formosa algae TaxID=225843 RepID=UPI000CCFC5C7|nr:PD-(D/E)XK nuclease family protein [Formosa algae]PNW26936.1 hypothetical protein BKP44_15160 [Formosa algae]